MLESLDNVSGHPGRSNLDLAGIPRKLTFNLANLSGHPGRIMYPGRDRIAWSDTIHQSGVVGILIPKKARPAFENTRPILVRWWLAASPAGCDKG